MYLPVVLCAAFLLAFAAPAMATTDCHQDMKEMLEGTLEVANDADQTPADHPASDGCTLADWQTGSALPAAIDL